jgi:hypothetical protein
MRKTLFWLFSMFLFVTLPAFAQHNNGGGGGSHGGGFGGGHSSVGSGSHSSGGGAAHSTTKGQGQTHGTTRNAPNGSYRGGNGYRGNGYHGNGYNRGGYGRGYGNAREHFNGGRYDREYFGSHWGGYNRFYWGGCNWWGPRFGVGSWFWFGGGYWTIIEPIPYWWYDDEVYVDWVDGYGYALIDPLYPGVYFRLGVRF